MKKVVIANLKDTQDIKDSKLYFTKLISKFDNESIELIICPPYTSISLAKFFTEGTGVKIGAQNVVEEDNIPITGEITAKELKNAGVDYVIVGHPERRAKFKETNALANKKIKSALKQGLKCILCIGETSAEKLAGKTEEVVKKQLEECIKGLYENELESLIISYEPVWAVGTEQPANIKDIETGAKVIRKAIKEIYSEKAGRDIVVVYGGSLNIFNSFKLLNAKEIDGAMYGANSQDVEVFTSIINKIK